MIVGSFCAQTDPALFSGADAAVAVEELATSIRQLTAKQAQFAARVDECHSHSRRFASSDDFLARVNGSSRGDAKRAIDTARRLRLAPGAASDAFDQGRLSVGEADAISAAAALDPSAEGRLVERATTSHDLADVRERADKVKAAARKGEDPAVRRARLRALRRWREFDRDGMREVMGRFVREDWARVAPVIDAYLEAQFQQARREGRREPIEAYRADAVLAALAAAGEAVGLTPAAKPTTATEPVAPVGHGSTESTETAALPAESHEIETADDASESSNTAADAESVDADS